MVMEKAHPFLEDMTIHQDQVGIQPCCLLLMLALDILPLRKCLLMVHMQFNIQVLLQISINFKISIISSMNL